MKQIKLHTSESLPGGENYRYWMASNGMWIVKENDFWKTVLPVDSTEELDLQPMQRELKLKGFRLPFQLVSQAVEFFRHVYRASKAEAFLWITQDDETGELGLACPTQTNRPAHVHAEVDDSIPDGHLKVGDVHSHPCSAFHSDGDVEDELHSDGVHIVVGHLERPIPEFAASLVVRGERIELDPAEIMDLSFGFNTEWLEKINPSSRTQNLRRLLGGKR